MPLRNQFDSEAEWLAHLRLYFAAKAMAAMIGTSAAPAMGGLEGYEPTLAAHACRMADAMLAARASLTGGTEG